MKSSDFLSKLSLFKYSFTFVFFLIVIFSVFFIKIYNTTDPDFGWHLRTGEIIIKEGIPKTDPFSYTMPNFPYVDHAWLTDVFIVVIYSSFGKLGLTIVFSLLMFVILILAVTLFGNSGLYNAVRSSDNIKLLSYLISLLLGSAVLVYYASVRTHLFSWLFFLIVAKILLNKRIWNKYKYFIPVVFLLWANLHGGFLAGFLLVGICLVVNFIYDRNAFKELLILFVASILFTLLNPYFIDLWREVLTTVADNDLKKYIAEWKSLVFTPILSFGALFGLTVGFLSKYSKQIEVSPIILFLVFTILAISSVKNLPFWVVITMPILVTCLNYLVLEIEQVKYAKKRLLYFLNILLVISLVVFLLETKIALNRIKQISITKHTQEVGFIDFLKTRNSQGNIFNEYGLGGYLIWKYPEKRVFIDGRMAIWEMQDSTHNYESDAFDKYINIIKGKVDYKEAFEKYDIDTVVWINKKYTSSDPKQLFIEKLIKDGWLLVYEDNYVIIYSKQ